MIKYYEYILSDAWSKRSEPTRERNGGFCECCNMRYGEHVHHRTYERLGKEKDEDLLHLCGLCHAMVHGLLPIGKNVWPSRLVFLNQLIKEQENEQRS